MASQDPGLSQHNVLILDDVHLRTKYSDSACEYVKRIRKTRTGNFMIPFNLTDLKIIILCAQDEGEKLQKYFDCSLLTIPVPPPEIEIYYTSEPEVNYVESAARSVVQVIGLKRFDLLDPYN
jgi:pre-mRNA-splicing factor ATP-dependent RNA helicase DHX15/PRP43